MRWQTEHELVVGKGQFTCGNKICLEKEDLKSWEVNFGYIEHGEKKHALVKLRLCDACSKKLNYKHKRKEIKRLKRFKKQEHQVEEKKLLPTDRLGPETSENIQSINENKFEEMNLEESEIWKAPIEEVEESSRDEEFEKYLEHLLL